MAIQIRIADQKLNGQPDIFIRDKSADGLRERLQLFITGDQAAVIITLDAPLRGVNHLREHRVMLREIQFQA
jgi:hypothetical protein